MIAFTRRNAIRAALTLAAALAASQVLAGFAGTDVFLPSVGRKPGNFGSQYYTMLWIHNPSASTANVTIAFLLRDHPNPAPATFLDSIPPGDSHSYPDTITTLFNTQAWGALRITANVRVLAVCRMYNLPAAGQDKDTQGQGYNAIPASFAIGSGQSTKLLGVSQTNPKADSQFRYSFGWVEAAGGTADVQVVAFDESGTQVASKTYPTTGAYEARYYPIEDLYPAVNATDLTLQVSVVSGTGKVIVVGSGTANVSNDSTTFEMQFADSLLGGSGGLSAVSHDASLTGDGTASAPLGIANGGVGTAQLASAAVTTDKISASGSSSGQVLTSSGSAVTWQNAAAGFTLPYSGTGNSASPLFNIYNSGAGIAVQGGSTGSQGVYGATTAPNYPGTYGVSASSTNGFGVKGDAPLGTTGVGVDGLGSWIGVRGISGSFGVRGESNNGVGVYGFTANGQEGVYGESDRNNGYGVYGVAHNGSSSAGVYGEGLSGAGVWGSAASGWGVHGESTTGIGVEGTSYGPTGVKGTCFKSGGTGVYGEAEAGTGAVGVLGGSAEGTGVAGSSGSGKGVSGIGKNGVYGEATAATGNGVWGLGKGSGNGVLGESSTGYGVTGVSLNQYGVRGDGGNIGVYAHNETVGGHDVYIATKALAIDAYGDVNVRGNLSKSSGSFRIDHPLDPANKYLSHSFVESPDMMNVYNGNVVTDAVGVAVVELPTYFEALNRDFRYQLTVIGRFAQAIVEQEIEGNRFVIRTNLANVKVSWQVTGIRKDPWANAHRILVEESKAEADLGNYVHPELYGQPAERSVGRADHAEPTELLQAERENPTTSNP